MSSITGLLAERAFLLGRQGKIAEAVYPLHVSAQLGGDARTSEIADVVAWTLAEQADAALSNGQSKDAAALAGLGLAAAPNIRCLLILCFLHGERDRAAGRFFAEKLIAAADRSTAPTRWAAFRYLLDALLRPQAPTEVARIVVRDLTKRLEATRVEDPDHAEAEAVRAALAAAPAKLLGEAAAEGPASAASQRALHRSEAAYHALIGQGGLVLAHCAAILSLCEAEDHALTQEIPEIERLARPFLAEGAGDGAEQAAGAAETDQAIDAVLTRGPDAIAALIRRLLAAGEIAAAQSAAGLPAPAMTESERWFELQHLRALAKGWQAEEPEAARDARACAEMIAATAAVVASDPTSTLRLRRGLFLVERDQRDAALTDLAAALEHNPTQPAYGGLWTVMRLHWGDANISGLKAAATIARRAPPQEHLEWICVFYHKEIADRWTPGAARVEIEAAAAAATFLRTDAMLRESPLPFEFRLQRSFFSVGNNLFKYALDDLVVLFAALKGDEAREKVYGPYVSRHILYLRVPSLFPEVDRVLRYLLEDAQFDPKNLLTYYLFAAQAGRMDVAYRIAEQMAVDRPEWGLIRRLKEFMEVENQTPAVVLGRAPRGRRVIYANMVCWGRRFVEKMAWGSLSSLLAEGNFPALCAEHDVVFDIVTHADDVSAICALPEIGRLSEHCEIRLYCLPDVPDFARLAAATQYFVFGHAQHFTVLRAQKDNVDVLLLASDVVYANGFLDFIRRNVSDEPRGLFFDGLNCSLTPVRAALQERRSGTTLTIDARSLAEIAVRNFKPISLHCFFDRSGASRKSEMSMLFLRKPFGFRIYSLCQAPVYASAAALQGMTGFDFLAVEGKLSELLLARLSPEQVITRRTTDDLLWIELDDNDRWELIPLGDKPVSHVDAVVNFFRFSARSQARFKLFDRSVDCHVEGLAHGDLIDDETEARFVAEVNRRRTNDPVLTELCVE